MQPQRDNLVRELAHALAASTSAAIAGRKEGDWETRRLGEGAERDRWNVGDVRK